MPANSRGVPSGVPHAKRDAKRAVRKRLATIYPTYATGLVRLLPEDRVLLVVKKRAVPQDV
jgi:hypothetical protein